MKSFHCRCLTLFLAPFLVAGAACQRPEEPPQPADLLPKEKMVDLLANLHVLEARVESSRLSQDSARALYLTQQQELLWKSGVTDSAFHRSYRYYGIHGKDLDGIYKDVIDSLGRREKRLPAPARVPAPPPAAPPAQAK